MVSEKSDTSVTLDFTLPEEGTPPFINVILEFSEPVVMQRNFSGNYMPGQTVKKQVGNLSPLTAYTLKARAVNYAGNGPSSDTINFITGETETATLPSVHCISCQFSLLCVYRRGSTNLHTQTVISAAGGNRSWCGGCGSYSGGCGCLHLLLLLLLQEEEEEEEGEGEG